MKTGKLRDDRDSGRYVRTPQQVEEDLRRKATPDVLRDHGIDLRRDFSFTTGQVEQLAAVAAT